MAADPERSLANVMSGLAAAMVLCIFGLGASWVLGRMLYEGHRAREWVPASATVNGFGPGTVAYQYTFRGVRHTGDRLGPNPYAFTDNTDSWHDDMGAMLASAFKRNTPIAIWVNPANPSESMVDRNIRWVLVVAIAVLALAFTVGGVAALVLVFRTSLGPWRKHAHEARPASPATRSAGPTKQVVLFPDEEEFVRSHPGHEQEMREWVGGMPPALRILLVKTQTPLWRLYPYIIFGLAAAIILGACLMILIRGTGHT